MGAGGKEGARMTPEEWWEESTNTIAKFVEIIRKYPELKVLVTLATENREAILSNGIRIIGAEARIKALQERLYSLMEDFEDLKERVEDLEERFEELKEGEE